MIEAILSKLNAIPADKVAHFASGTILFALALPGIGAQYAMALVIIVGFVKELYDALNREHHTPDVWDVVATILGGLTAYSCTL